MTKLDSALMPLNMGGGGAVRSSTRARVHYFRVFSNSLVDTMDIYREHFTFAHFQLLLACSGWFIHFVISLK